MKRLALVALLAASGCVTSPAVPAGFRLDPKAGDECRGYCDTLGMSMEAVVVMGGTTGCVCAPREKASAAPSAAAGGAAAGAIAFLQEAERRNEQQRRHHMGPGPHVP